MSTPPTENSNDELQSRLLADLDELCDRFEEAWCNGENPRIEDSIAGLNEPLRTRLLQELVSLEVAYRQEQDQTPDRAEYEARFAEDAAAVREAFDSHGWIDASSVLAETVKLADSPTPSGHLAIRCPSCNVPMEVAVDTSLTELTCGSCGSHFSLVDQEQSTRQAPPLSKLGRFELLERLGVGGFGSVWKARDKELDRTVAIKIPRQGTMTAEEQERFFHEARAVAQLRHDNIVSIHEVGRDGDSVYIVSDFVRGVTLEDWLTGQQLTNREAAELCAKIADALHHAHEAGVVHRDLKPANIIIDGDLEPHLMDFGLARRDVGEVTITIEGQVLGTPAYMSPEQAQGEAHQADRRSDVYSLGVILFQLLTGERPFRGNPRMLMHQVVYDEPPSPRKLNAHVSKDLETICLKCLEKNPGRRYQTASECGDELQRFLAGEPINARPISQLERGWRWCRRRPLVASLSASIVCLVVAATLSAITAAAWFMVLAEERETARLDAVTAQHNESDQRRQAEALGERNRQSLYASRINLAHQAWQEGDVARVLELLESLRPEPGQSDLRSFEWYYLWQLCHSAKHTLRKEGRAMRSVAFSPDGLTVAAGGDDKVVRLWDVVNGKEQPSLRGHRGWINAMAFSPHGDMLATASADKTVKLWDNETHELLATLEGHQQEVSCLAFAPDGQTLATGTGLLSSESGNPLTRFVRPKTQSEVKLWGVASRSEIAAFEAHDGDVLSLAFSPDGSQLATGGADRAAKVWQVAGIQEQPPMLLEHGDPVMSVAFSSDGQTVATGDWSGFYRLWDTANARQRAAVDAHTGPIFCVRFSPDGKLLVTTGHDQNVRLWDANTGEDTGRIRGHTNAVMSAVFSPDSTTLATVSNDGTVKLWDVTRPQEFYSLHDANKGEPPEHYTVAFSPDGKLLASASKIVEVWNFAEGKKVRTLDGYEDGDLTVKFSPDGKTLAAAGSGGAVKLWDTTTWQLKSTLSGHPGKVWSFVFSSDGKLLATASEGGVIKLWDVVTFREHRTIVTKLNRVRCLDFSPDGGILLASGSAVPQYDHPGLQRWAVESCRELTPIAHADFTDWLAFSPDGETVAIGTGQIAMLWRADPPRHLSTLRGHMDVLYNGAFAPDGKTLATAGWDGTVRLWHVATGQELMVLRGTTGLPVWNVAFAPDGSSLVMGSGFRQPGNIRGEIVIYRAEKISPH